jgi:hypothetical protein
MCGCGLPAIEMKGNEEDWAKLVTKIDELQKTLAPVEKVLKYVDAMISVPLSLISSLKGYFAIARSVLEKLLLTYQTGAAMASWWEKILVASMISCAFYVSHHPSHA